ncbi:MAG: hypothetical protein HY926_09270 [Elusimicrobia bacterium]|nr:hypothetical protein [Elusimicrobiota bacterium]
MRPVRFLAAFLLCGVALLLPYRARVLYGALLAGLAHAPFILFGALSRRLLRQLGMSDFPGGSSHGAG